MLKKTITYTDFNDNERTEDFYFNLSRAELTEMETSIDGGLHEMLKRIVAEENIKEIFKIFKRIVVSSVGIKSADGRHFMKSDEIVNNFIASPAFDQLFMELLSDSGKAGEFIRGLVPADLRPEYDAKQIEVAPVLKEVGIEASKSTEVG